MIAGIKADRTTAVVGLSVLCVAILVIVAIADFWLLRQQYVKDIENITPRTARLLGIIDSEEQLAKAAADVRDVLGELAYPSEGDSAMTAASMQQQIREIMTSTGLSVTGSQILPSEQIEGFEQLNLDISVEGNIDSVDEAIVSLKVLYPLVLIESVNVKPQRTRGARRGGQANVESVDQRKLFVRFRLLSLRLLR